MELAKEAVDDTPLLDLMGDALKDISELNPDDDPPKEDSP